MMFQDPLEDAGRDTASDPLISLVLQSQQNYAEWTKAVDLEAKSSLGAAYRHSLEALWSMIADDLRKVARGWVRSNIASDIDTLALNMFANIVFSLPKLRIDPQRNVRNLLITLARRGLIDEYRRTYATDARRQSISSDEDVNSIGTNSELIDPHSSDIEEQTAQKLDRSAILQIVWDYWQSTLSESDFRIMKLRWQSEPPVSFRDVAEQIGSGWMEATVRQRHHRIMDATRNFLRGLGVIDESEQPGS